jgi:hypothetical protein
LLISWVLAPVQYADTTPATLRHDFKDEYRYMIAAAYSTTGNLARARARLTVLGDTDPVKSLGDQAQSMLANNASPDTVRILADLSQALQGNQLGNPVSSTVPTSLPSANPVSVAQPTSPNPSTEVPATDTPVPATHTPVPASFTLVPAVLDTASPAPTHAPTSTPGAPFVLASEATFCDASQPGLLQVNLKDSSGKPAAGMELVITWLGGEEHFFTGLKPELGNGYADFVMSPDVEYALTLSNGATRVTGMTASVCTATNGSTFIGGIHLEFTQP